VNGYKKSRNYRFFTAYMSKNPSFSLFTIVVLLFSGLFFSCSSQDESLSPEVVKIALREAGNQLLLSEQDSTSLILPIIQLEDFKYQLSFEKMLSFEPNSLVTAVQESLNKASLSGYYRVEVIQCIDGEVAYSYEMSANRENTIIPCAGRELTEKCYEIELVFTNQKLSSTGFDTLWILLVLLVLVLVAAFFYTKNKKANSVASDGEFNSFGSFRFYPEQNKLVKAAVEISLSQKECQLLEILVASPNQIVTRDELTKRIWEDKGVFVGRSLDTYISKLRKKLQDDDTIKITNVHGVGYKLEITK